MFVLVLPVVALSFLFLFFSCDFFCCMFFLIAIAFVVVFVAVVVVVVIILPSCSSLFFICCLLLSCFFLLPKEVFTYQTADSQFQQDRDDGNDAVTVVVFEGRNIPKAAEQ